MENQNEQLNLFTKKDFERRDIEQAGLMKAEANLETPHFFVPWMGNDCVYYVGAKQCAAHGDFVACMDCDDYRSSDDDTADDD